MKIENYTCDGCGNLWDLKRDPMAYEVDLVSLTGDGIMGDNRITRTWHLCEHCFNKVYKVIKTTD